MRIVVATNNAHKLAEMADILSPLGFELCTLSDVGFDAEIVEDGDTFVKNALIKATTVAAAVGLPAIADDSGLCVDALDGAPGVYSARYGGDACTTDAERTALLLQNMEGEINRAAHFVSAIAIVYPDGRKITVEGRVDGAITRSPRGDGGFGYDPVFLLACGKTLSEIPAQEKNRISHRAVALQKISDIFSANPELKGK